MGRFRSAALLTWAAALGGGACSGSAAENAAVDAGLDAGDGTRGMRDGGERDGPLHRDGASHDGASRDARGADGKGGSEDGSAESAPGDGGAVDGTTHDAGASDAETHDAADDTPPSGCVIGGTAYVSGDPNPNDSCESCVPATSSTGWTTTSADGTACAGGTCCSGACSDLATDLNNCGACGNACNQGTNPVCNAYELCQYTLGTGSCAYGCPAIAANATTVYWTSSGTTSLTDGTVLAVPAVGGSVTTFAPEQVQPIGITLDGANVYWANAGDIQVVPVGEYGYEGVGTPGGIMEAPLDGGTPTTLVSLTAESTYLEEPTYLAVDSANVYWTNDWNAVWEASLADGATSMLTYSTGYGPWHIAAGGGNVFWTDNSSEGDVEQFTPGVDGGAPMVLAIDQDEPGSIAVDTQNVYWVVGANVMYAPIASDTPMALAAEQINPIGLAIDDSNAYWTSGGTSANGYMDGAVLSVPKGGGVPVTLASGLNAPGAMAVTADGVYWIDGDGTVMKVQKPRPASGSGFVPPVLAGVGCSTALSVTVGTNPAQSWPTYLQTSADATAGTNPISSYEWCWSTSSTGCATAGFPSSGVMYTGDPGWIGALGAYAPAGGGPGTFGPALTPNTGYWLSAVAVDSAGNMSSVAETASSCTTAISANTNVYPIFVAECNSCHNGAALPGPFDQAFFVPSQPAIGASYASACSATLPVEAYVYPGQTGSSLIYGVMNGGACGAGQMPPGGPDTTGTGIVGTWISQGANFVQ
jgi:hypothetical protein